MIARFLLAALLALLQAATVAWAADTATSKSAGWQRARVVFTADNPTAVAIDRERLYVLVAPFLRGVKDGTSGIVGIDRSTGATTTLLRSTPTLLPNHLAEVQADATRLYWLNGLAIMATDKASGQTRLLAAPGSSAMTLHGGTLYSFNYDNKRTLTAIDAATGRVTDLAPLPLLASRIAADWALGIESPCANVSRKPGMKICSGPTKSASSITACAESAVAIVSVPVSTIVSARTRPLKRVATKLPVNSPSGHSTK